MCYRLRTMRPPSQSGTDICCSWWDSAQAQGQWGVQGVTRTFAAYSKFSNASSVAHLGFMATCIVELFSLDESASYAHAFTAIKVSPIILDAFRALHN